MPKQRRKAKEEKQRFCSVPKMLSQIARKRLLVWLLYPYANRDKIRHNKQANKVLFPCVDTLNLFKFWHGGHK